MAHEVQNVKQNVNTKEKIIVPPVDIYETENEFVMRADLPSVSKDSIDITVDNGELEINAKISDNFQNDGEAKYREYKLFNYNRTFKIGNDIDSEKINATMENGVLTLTLPKREEVKPKRIEVEIH